METTLFASRVCRLIVIISIGMNGMNYVKRCPVNEDVLRFKHSINIRNRQDRSQVCIT